MLKPPAADADGTKYFRATYELKEGTDITAVEADHAAYMEKLLNEKKLRASGPYVNNPLAGLSILSIADAAAAEAIVKGDPYVEKLAASWQVIEWDPGFGDFK